ncbi:MAG: signal peptidase I [Clostridiales bacterium]|nr:signal peptidase I [Clostridiales bacterium]
MGEISTSESGKTKKNKGKARRIASWCGLAVLFAICAALLVHSLLCIFMDGYYPTFGGYRLIAVVTDSMEPEIPTGDMIVTKVPNSSDEIKEGTVITFEVKDGNNTYLLTHRVTAVRVDGETGGISYTTRGDNADGTDRIHPEFEDVVGIYTGNRCGVFGYIFGFIQSSQGAIALIVIVFIIILTVIIIWFVNKVTTWRRIAMEALQKSGSMLSGTDNPRANTVADVLGIVSRDPKNRLDLKRKNKKLERFMRTGSLPRRPYSDDVDDHAEPDMPQSEPAPVQEQQPVQENTDTAVATPEVAPIESATPAPEPVQEAVQEPAPTPEQPHDIVDELGEVAATTQAAVDSTAKIRYDYTCRARLIQLKPEGKDFYSLIKNELLSYAKVSAEDTKSFEKYTVDKNIIARITVRGKTLNVSLALDPDDYVDTKYRMWRNKNNTPAKLKITSARQAEYAIELIADMMNSLGLSKKRNYEAQDFYMPYEGIASLLSKGLVWRRKVVIPRVVEECERLSYDMTLSARLSQLDKDDKVRYSTVKNELLSYENVRINEGKRAETYMIGRKTVAKINVSGKTVCLLLALDPEKYADGKFKVAALNNPRTPLKFRLSGDERTEYALELIADLMAGEGTIKNENYEPTDFRPEYENIVALMNKGLARRKLTNKTQEFAVELVKKK